MEEFPLPYVLTNCHNSLCAVGGTINEDDHVFGRGMICFSVANYHTKSKKTGEFYRHQNAQ